MEKLTLLLGGARSGKSAYALEEASRIPGQKAFVATAQAFDDEMKIRIEKHKTERGNDWTTFEEPLHIVALLREIGTSHSVILLDCFTLWVSNVMHSSLDFHDEVENLVETLTTGRSAPIYIVSNEVGLGLVPESELGRAYRDNLGFLNRRIAMIASTVYFMVAGIPLAIKEI